MALAGLMGLAASSSCRHGASVADQEVSSAPIPEVGAVGGASTGVAAAVVASAAVSAAAAEATVLGSPSAQLDCGTGLGTSMIADSSLARDVDPMPADTPIEPATAALGGMAEVIGDGDPVVVLELIEQSGGAARVLGRSGERPVVVMSLTVRGGRWHVDSYEACYAGESWTQVPPPIPQPEIVWIDAQSRMEPPADGVVPAVDVPALLAVARPAFDRRTPIHALHYGTYVHHDADDAAVKSVPAIDFTAFEPCANHQPIPPASTQRVMCTRHVIVQLETISIVANTVTLPTAEG
ncbi:MAG: hypothetical protein AB7W59_21340 [Acidimicrobiia bacterium]